MFGVGLVLLVLAGAAGGGAYYAYTKGFRFQFLAHASKAQDEVSAKTQRSEAGSFVKLETLKGERTVYSFKAREGTWKRDEVLKSFHEQTGKGLYRPDLALQLMDPALPGESARASFLVLVLQRADNRTQAARVARDLIESPQNKNDYPDLQVEDARDANDKPINGRAAVGDTADGHIMKLFVRETEERKRFVVLGVVNRPENLIVLVGECPWDRRADWEPKFDKMLESFRVKGVK
jgi:hypothetical protein